MALPVPADDLPLLLTYSWPGNARELAAVIDRAVILGQGKRLEIEKALGMPLGPSVQSASGDGGTAECAPLNNTDAEPGAAVSQRLDDVVRGHIERVLASTQGKIEGPFGAARRLDLNPHTLRARMRKLGIDWTKFRERS
jgi:transcriptional regulator with GAF, ATPase, and Fis domain